MCTDIDKILASVDNAASNVVQLLRKNKMQLTTAESCTGGLLSAAITSVSGASEVFFYGQCTYANICKSRFLGVKPETLAAYGAVSRETAAEMALGAVQAAEADIGVSVTGIAGPEGGTAEKPVGTVYIACADAKGEAEVRRLQIDAVHVPSALRRQYIRHYAVLSALRLIEETALQKRDGTETKEK